MKRFDIVRCTKQKMFLCTVCHWLKEPGLIHQATPINTTATHMHILILNNCSDNHLILTILWLSLVMQLNIHITLTATKCSSSQLTVANNDASCNDKPSQVHIHRTTFGHSTNL